MTSLAPLPAASTQPDVSRRSAEPSCCLAMCQPPPKLPLAAPTRSYLRSTPGERRLGFAAASTFSVIYYLAPVYIAYAVAYACLGSQTAKKWALASPLLLSLCVPGKWLPKLGGVILRCRAMRQIPKYFRFEEYHELSDGEVAARTKSGERFVFCFHPHGVFPFVATCAMISSFKQGRKRVIQRAIVPEKKYSRFESAPRDHRPSKN